MMGRQRDPALAARFGVRVLSYSDAFSFPSPLAGEGARAEAKPSEGG